MKSNGRANIRGSLLSQTMNKGLPARRKTHLDNPKRFRVAQVSSLSQTKSETSILEGAHRHRLIKNFKMQSNFIQNKQNTPESKNKPRNEDPPRSPRFQDSFDKHKNKLFKTKLDKANSFRSEIMGIDESKLMMKKSVGRFSRLERFRMRAKGGIVRKRGKTQNKPKRFDLANSVFESVNNVKSTTSLGSRSEPG